MPKMIHLTESGQDWFINLEQITYAYTTTDGKVIIKFDNGRDCWFALSDGKELLDALKKATRTRSQNT